MASSRYALFEGSTHTLRAALRLLGAKASTPIDLRGTPNGSVWMVVHHDAGTSMRCEIQTKVEGWRLLPQAYNQWDALPLAIRFVRGDLAKGMIDGGALVKIVAIVDDATPKEDHLWMEVCEGDRVAAQHQARALKDGRITKIKGLKDWAWIEGDAIKDAAKDCDIRSDDPSNPRCGFGLIDRVGRGVIGMTTTDTMRLLIAPMRDGSAPLLRGPLPVPWQVLRAIGRLRVPNDVRFTRTGLRLTKHYPKRVQTFECSTSAPGGISARWQVEYGEKAHKQPIIFSWKRVDGFRRSPESAYCPVALGGVTVSRIDLIAALGKYPAKKPRDMRVALAMEKVGDSLQVIPLDDDGKRLHGEAQQIGGARLTARTLMRPFLASLDVLMLRQSLLFIEGDRVSIIAGRIITELTSVDDRKKASPRRVTVMQGHMVRTKSEEDVMRLSELNAKKQAEEADARPE